MIEKIKSKREELKTLEGHDRLQYLVDIAREVKPLADDEKIDDNKIRGQCLTHGVVVTRTQTEQ